MKQIVLQEKGRLVCEDAPAPVAAADEALVRVRRVGVCGTDLHAFAGRQPFFAYPRILGHEMGVEVLLAPENDRGIRPGDRCAVEPLLACGVCRACRRGKTNCCEKMQVLGVHVDGGMRQLLSVPVRLLHKSETLRLDQLALVEPLSIGAHAVERAAPAPGDEVLVIGAGPIGLAVVQFALAAGAEVCVLEPSRPRRARVERLGVETPAEPDRRRWPVVIDATGNRAAMEAAFDRVAHGGRLVLVGVVQDHVAFYDPLFHAREMTLLASRNSAGLFPKIIRMIERGRIDTTPWISHRLALTEVPQQFAALSEQPNLLKAMIEVKHVL